MKKPLYLHGSDGDVKIQIADVPVAFAGSVPESLFVAIHLPFVPATDGSWNEPSDVNATSVYGISVAAADESTDKLGVWRITVDASAAKRPEGYPFTIKQVIDATVTCVKMMRPTRDETEQKVIIKVVPPKK